MSFEEWNLPCTHAPCSYSAGMNLDVHVTEKLTAALMAAGASVTSISGFGPPGAGDRPLPLGWAEVIPAYFIQRAYNESNAGPAAGSAAVSEATSRPQSLSGSTQGSGGLEAGQAQAQAQRQGQGQAHKQVRPDRSLARRRLVASSQSTHGTHAAAASESSARPTSIYAGSAEATESANGEAAAAAAADARSAAPRLPRAVLLGLPSRRYDRSVSMVPELLALGRHLFTYLDPLDLRVAVVVGG